MLVECLPLEDALCLADADGFDCEEQIIPCENGAQQEVDSGFVWRESSEFDLFEQLGISTRKHPAVWDALKLALENAFLRGNNNCPSKRVYVRSAIGRKCIVVQIEDEGRGFDYRAIVQKMFANQPYSQGSGRGLRSLHEADVTAGYQGRGNIVNIVVARSEIV